MNCYPGTDIDKCYIKISNLSVQNTQFLLSEFTLVLKAAI